MPTWNQQFHFRPLSQMCWRKMSLLWIFSQRGLTFKSLVDATRRQVAESLLRDSRYTATEVAFLTGFSEQSAFNRAFKRWTRQTPTAFRDAERS